MTNPNGLYRASGNLSNRDYGSFPAGGRPRHPTYRAEGEPANIHHHRGTAPAGTTGGAATRRAVRGQHAQAAALYVIASTITLTPTNAAYAAISAGMPHEPLLKR